MQSEMFEKDYSELKGGLVSAKTDAAQDRVIQFSAENRIFAEIGKRMRELPHIINPIKKAQYEKALDILNEYALTHSGKIQGVVSFEEFDAFIYLTLKFFEFNEKENKEISYIYQTARSVAFYPTDDGMMRMSVRYDYFEDVGDMDQIIEEVLAEHPEINDLMLEAKETELAELLADPKIHAVLEKGAKEFGVTPEEYLKVIDEICKNDPQFVIDLLLGREKDERTEE